MLTKQMTGNQRYRVLQRLLRHPVLVLQVEELTTGYTVENECGYVSTRDVNQKTWRDAQVEDLCH